MIHKISQSIILKLHQIPHAIKQQLQIPEHLQILNTTPICILKKIKQAIEFYLVVHAWT